MVQARAVLIEGKGDIDVLRIGTLEVREPGPGEVLVEVAAAGLNRADILQRRGFYPAPKGVASNVPGLEYAGTVVRVGTGAGEFAVGDRVMGIIAGGGMATHVVVHARETLKVPQNLSLEQAGAVPEVFLTAYDALFSQARLGIGQVVLLHAVGSGVGTAALQLARASGAHTIGTSRSAGKLELCKPLGLQDAILVTDQRFAAEVTLRSAGRGADVILDSVGAAYLAENLAALAPRGRLVLIGLMAGASGEIALSVLLAKRAQLIGTVLRSRPLEEKATLAQAFARNVLPLLERGTIAPVIDRVLPMQDIGEAHRRMERDENFGKIVLTW